jgi:hypothetical protein
LVVYYELIQSPASGMKPSKGFIQHSPGRGMDNQCRAIINQGFKGVDIPFFVQPDA